MSMHAWRIAAATLLVLFALPSLCQAPATSRRHRIFLPRDVAETSFVPDTPEARKLDLKGDLLRSIDRLKADLHEVSWEATSPSDADVAYTNLVLTRDDPIVELDAVFSESAKKPKGVSRRCEICLDHPTEKRVVRRVFMELVEETLFGNDERLYRPLQLTRCEKLSSSEVRATIKPANEIRLDNVTYILGHRISPNVVQRTPVQLEGETAAGSLNATFRVLGDDDAIVLFMSDCRGKPAEHLVLIPSLLPRLNSGRRNANFE